MKPQILTIGSHQLLCAQPPWHMYRAIKFLSPCSLHTITHNIESHVSFYCPLPMVIAVQAMVGGEMNQLVSLLDHTTAQSWDA